MQLPKVIDGSDLKQLRQLLDQTEAAVRGLKGIDISTETCGTFLTPVIMGKIPLILSRGTSEDWDLDTIIMSLTEELQIRKRCALGTVTEQTKLKEKREFGFGIRTGKNKRHPSHRQPCLQTTKDHRYLRINGALSAVDLIQLSNVLLLPIQNPERKFYVKREKFLVV